MVIHGLSPALAAGNLRGTLVQHNPGPRLSGMRTSASVWLCRIKYYEHSDPAVNAVLQNLADPQGRLELHCQLSLAS